MKEKLLLKIIFFLTGGRDMEAMTFVLFGSTGDLAKRKIYPALYNLFVDGKSLNQFLL